MSLGLAIILVSLTTFRLTHLVTTDVFPPVLWLRTRTARKFGVDSAITYLVHCQWCSGLWISMPVAWIAIEWPTNRLVLWFLLAMSASAVTGLISAYEPE